MRFYPVEDYPWYLVCDEGFIVNADTGAVIRGSVKGNGYVEACLRDEDGLPHYLLMHRLVASAFCEGKAPGKEVNHKNGLKTDNSAANLEWVDHGVNLKHAFDTGLREHDVSPRAVVATNRETGASIKFPSIYTAARVLGISQGNICSCCKGQRPYAGAFYWEYEGGTNE